MRIGQLIMAILLFFATAVYGEDESSDLGKIIAGIDTYKDRTVTLNLRLKQVDRIFEKIVFYDSSNIDIEFDISGKERKKALASDLLNIHEGMLYSVTFKVIGAGSLGGVLGEIESFKPVIVDLIPRDSSRNDSTAGQ